MTEIRLMHMQTNCNALVPGRLHCLRKRTASVTTPAKSPRMESLAFRVDVGVHRTGMVSRSSLSKIRTIPLLLLFSISAKRRKARYPVPSAPLPGTLATSEFTSDVLRWLISHHHSFPSCRRSVGDIKYLKDCSLRSLFSLVS